MLKLVRRKGSKCWYVRGSIAGRRYEESTGIAEKPLAETYRAKREWEISHARVFGERGLATFAQAAADYLEHARDARFVARLVDHFGAWALKDIDQSAAANAARALYPGAQPSTLNRQFYTPLAAVLNRAARAKLCDRIQFQRPKAANDEFRWLSPGEAEALVAACKGRLAFLRPLIVFLLYTGARAGEALTLDWRNVDLARAHVVFPKTKNGESRGVPLNPRVVGELAGLKRRVGRVFLNRSRRPYSVVEGGGSPIAAAFAAAVRGAGIAPATPHDMRHTWATWHYQANRDFNALRILGGWKTASMVFRYAHANRSEFAAGQDRLPGGNLGEVVLGGAPRR